MIVNDILKHFGTLFLSIRDRNFIYGPQGKMLMRNIEQHWMQYCMTMQPYNVFLVASDNISCTLKDLKENAMDEVPFGLITFEDSKSSWNQTILSPSTKLMHHKIAKAFIVTDAAESMDMYHKKQRERKVWWRKLVQRPSRVALTESKKMKNREVIELQIKFPFGDIIVETLSHYDNTRKLFTQEENSKNNEGDMHMIEHVVSLDWGCLALLCDSYTMDKSSKTQIHPKLSPYKAAFYVTRPQDETNTETDDLNRLVHYLNNVVRSKGFDTIVTSTEKVIEMCIAPFIVTVDKTSLKNGIIHIKSRSTTLAEAIHVTELVKYISLHCS